MNINEYDLIDPIHAIANDIHVLQLLSVGEFMIKDVIKRVADVLMINPI